MQHEVTTVQPLLNEKGQLNECGWARQPLWDYQRAQIRPLPLCRKEWDHYLVYNERFAIAFTVADLGYAGWVSVSFTNLCDQTSHTRYAILPLPRKQIAMPLSSVLGDTVWDSQKIGIKMFQASAFRGITCEFLNFQNGKNLYATFTLETPKQDSMVLVAPFAKEKKQFIYTRKALCMPAQGRVQCGGELYEFDKKDSYGIMSWGRGVCPPRNTWQWASLSTNVNGVPFGLNVGSGLGDSSAANENAIFFGKTVHKLEQVAFSVPNGDPEQPWNLSSSDGRLAFTFTPMLKQKEQASLVLLHYKKQRIFGHYSGTAVLDDGTVIRIQHKLGFAEEIKTKW